VFAVDQDVPFTPPHDDIVFDLRNLESPGPLLRDPVLDESGHSLPGTLEHPDPDRLLDRRVGQERVIWIVRAIFHRGEEGFGIVRIPPDPVSDPFVGCEWIRAQQVGQRSNLLGKGL
jgi:hypothetical protein